MEHLKRVWYASREFWIISKADVILFEIYYIEWECLHGEYVNLFVKEKNVNLFWKVYLLLTELLYTVIFFYISMNIFPDIFRPWISRLLSNIQLNALASDKKHYAKYQLMINMICSSFSLRHP